MTEKVEVTNEMIMSKLDEIIANLNLLTAPMSKPEETVDEDGNTVRKYQTPVLPGVPATERIIVVKAAPPEPEPPLSAEEKRALQIALEGYIQVTDDIIECPENPEDFVSPGEDCEWVKITDPFCPARNIWKRVAA